VESAEGGKAFVCKQSGQEGRQEEEQRGRPSIIHAGQARAAGAGRTFSGEERRGTNGGWENYSGICTGMRRIQAHIFRFETKNRGKNEELIRGTIGKTIHFHPVLFDGNIAELFEDLLGGIKTFHGLEGLADGAQGGMALGEGGVGKGVEDGDGGFGEITQGIDVVSKLALEGLFQASGGIGAGGIKAVFVGVLVAELAAALTAGKGGRLRRGSQFDRVGLISHFGLFSQFGLVRQIGLRVHKAILSGFEAALK
jgi:hypothetical protein